MRVHRDVGNTDCDECVLHKGAYKCLDCRAVEKRRRKLEGK